MTVKSAAFPASFYVANSMEVFERLAWYGFFTLSSVYMTTPVEQGGVGFSEQQRGALQGIIPFFLYLLPVLTGALADRFGYRRMFLLSFAIMAPAYYLLGQATSFAGFFLALSAVALGAACFKPVVVGTIGHSTNDQNRGLGFGIFYTMVNIGGFIGPLVAGYMRAISWDAVFLMSACWILLNFIPGIFLFKDPPSLEKSQLKLKQVLKQAQDVLGNGRFALLLFPCIVLLMAAGVGWLGYQLAFSLIASWLVINFVWDRLASKQNRSWFKQPIQVSNKPFALYLAILTGFWTIYNQLFYTMPLFIRDFVDTGDLVQLLAWFGQGTVEFFAFVNTEQLTDKLVAIAGLRDMPSWHELQLQLVHLKVRVPEQEIQQGLLLLQQSADLPTSARQLANVWASQYRQINPEYLINLDFAAIVIFQILVSYCCQFFRTILVLVFGVLVSALGWGLAVWADNPQLGGSIVVIVILSIALGEMLTSPKSQEYVASIAPKQQTALYMGYYFVCMALGFLFAGLLSGWSYGSLALEQGKPEWMWAIFVGIGLLTSLGLYVFHRTYLNTGIRAQTAAETMPADPDAEIGN